MYKIDDIGSTYLSLPPNLQDVDAECFGYALDRQMKIFKKLAEDLTMWSDMDSVDPKYYDFMAMCLRAPYYKSEYTNSVKLKLLKTAVLSYRFAGTKKAISALLDSIFKRAYISPWFEYNGAPYHFVIHLYDYLEEDTITLFADVLQKVKAARSILDHIIVHREQILDTYISPVFIQKTINRPISEKFEAGRTREFKGYSGVFLQSTVRNTSISEKFDAQRETEFQGYSGVHILNSVYNTAISEVFSTRKRFDPAIYAKMNAMVQLYHASPIEEARPSSRKLVITS